jgi:hypothetical protein
MLLRSALRHMKEKHQGCYSCYAEQILLRHLLMCRNPPGTCHWVTEHRIAQQVLGSTRPKT